MASSWRTTARMLATAATASAVSRAADPVRRLLEEASKSPEVNGPIPPPTPLQLVETGPEASTVVAPEVAAAPAPIPAFAAQAAKPHEFGPAPVTSPTRGVGFQNTPRNAAEAPLAPVAEMPAVTQARPIELRTSAPAEEPTRKNKPKKDMPSPQRSQAVAQDNAEERTGRGKHRRERSAISGTVTSSRGRGLRGMEVSVIDADEIVIATATSGTGGAFIVDGLPAGTYRVAGTDPDGDFATGWVGGASFAKASRLKVKDNSTRRKANFRLTATADIVVKVDRNKKATQLGVRVTERGTGIAATGRVTITNKLIGVELPLDDGKVDITLFGPGRGSSEPPKKAEITYLGDKHTAATSQSTTLR